MTDASRSARSTRQDWLDCGMALLRAEGEQGLTVDALCKRMGLTKGSFYHHFAGRDDFVARLLAHWEDTFTLEIIEEMDRVGDPVERLRALGERTARDVDLRLERAIRVWSDREPAARVVLERVDRQREAYLEDQFKQALGDPRRARLAARAHMALLVGTEILYQDMSSAEMRELNAFAESLGFAAEPATAKRRIHRKGERP